MYVSIEQTTVRSDRNVLVFIKHLCPRDGRKDVFGGNVALNTPIQGDAQTSAVRMPILLVMSSSVLSKMAEKIQSRRGMTFSPKLTSLNGKSQIAIKLIWKIYFPFYKN